MRIPGVNYHDRTSKQVTLAVYQLAVEALEKELGVDMRRDALAESRPLIECGAAISLLPHEAAPNPETVAYLTEAIKRMSEEVRK